MRRVGPLVRRRAAALDADAGNLGPRIGGGPVEVLVAAADRATRDAAVAQEIDVLHVHAHDVAAGEADLVAAAGEADHHLAAQVARQRAVGGELHRRLGLGDRLIGLDLELADLGRLRRRRGSAVPSASSAITPAAIRIVISPVIPSAQAASRRQPGSSRSSRRFSDSKCRNACCASPAICRAVCSASASSILCSGRPVCIASTCTMAVRSR